MAGLSVETAFAKFPSLPAETRYMIWESAIPGPRTVTIRQKALDRPLGGCIEEWNFDEEGFPGETMNGNELGITSDCKPPQILFVCKESYRVASKFYQPAFATEGSFGETYFDFNRDVLYLRYDTLRFISPYYMSYDDLRCFDDLPSELSGITNLENVTNLAILIDPGATEIDLNDFYDTTTNLTHWVAQILAYFGAVSKLTLMVQHYKFEDHDDQSTLLLVDPIDLDEGFQQFSLYTGDSYGDYGCGPDISDLYYTKVDNKLLQSHLPHLTQKSKRPQSAPAIDYQICVTEEAKEVYEIEERGCELY
ncbi:hypothetical protein LSUB1_G005768 [Lachnellula subtilissima]|uniref:2EXR domain-containing protein n=1 Tax=Lachnellula subtilissima TaxID=602034 RepID=A0A8H8RQZ0_9HELO|nr:hypothetical protein LSUB1_G005768 [Lachnellula subtilissima]